MSDAKIRRITKLMNELNADGDVKNSGLESAYTSNAYATSAFTSNTYVSDVFVSNNFFQNSSTYREGEIIEELITPCNTTSLVGNGGTATISAVTTTTDVSTTETDVPGSEITGYVVPSGTKRVVYTFILQADFIDSSYMDARFAFYFKVGSGSYTEVTNAPVMTEMRNGYGGPLPMIVLTWPYEVGATSAVAADGVMTESTPTLSLKVTCTAGATNQRVRLHDSGVSGFTKPIISVKAIAGS